MKPTKINRIYYSFVRFLARFPRRFFFRCKTLRNEIRKAKAPFVVIANHEATLDFVNLITATKEPMNFVISSAFYRTLPFRHVVEHIGLLPKQQFQTSLCDITKMKSVIEHGGILVIYPAGLMSEDGVSTPLPQTTYKFLQWLKCDVYVARSTGTYFCTPKWATGKKLRRGKTYIDIFKLFSKEELCDMPVEDIKEKTDSALLFNSYEEQEKHLTAFRHGDNIEGLENVLYECPVCHGKTGVRDKNVIFCEDCGFAERADKQGFLHKLCGEGEEIRYVSEWNEKILLHEQMRIEDAAEPFMETSGKLKMISDKKHKYVELGRCSVKLYRSHFTVLSNIDGKEKECEIPTATFASLPFSPGKYFEIQHGADSFRIYPDCKSDVMKFVNKVKLCYKEHSEV